MVYMRRGGKAQTLQELSDTGFNVPFFVVCDRTWGEKEIMRAVDVDMPNVRYFAVRSSALVEDGATQSYAGQFYSALAVEREALYREVENVRTSFNGMDGVVILQEFIPSDVSGVAFSSVGDYVIINANAGLCKNVVEGKACDEYYLNEKGMVVSKTIGEHKPALWFRDGRLEEESCTQEALSDVQRNEVVALAKKVETHFAQPQDIEWCFRGDVLYLLQSRPITRKIAVPEQEYFDSANIAESYSGIVLPLTASFARRIYRIVYTDFLRMSGVPRSLLKKHAYVFDNLLGFFHGRMYYNMNNWYRLAQFVPGYKRNKKNFETMITSNLRKDIETTIVPSGMFTVLYPGIVLAKLLVFGLTTRRFIRYVERHSAQLNDTAIETLSFAECKALFDRLERGLLRKWYVTLENDFFVMTYLGILQHYYPEKQLPALLYFKSKATEQVAYVQQLSKRFKEVPELWRAVQKKDAHAFVSLLRDHPDLNEYYLTYLRLFGGRFANELKLETVGMDEDVTKCMTVLQAYEAYAAPTVAEHAGDVVPLPYFKRLFCGFALKKFKKYAARREVFRLYRSNMFSIARRIFRRAGVLMEEQGILKEAQDVFYLSVEEVFEAVGLHEAPDLSSRVIERKKTYAQYHKETPPSHFLAVAGTVVDAGGQDTSRSVLVRGVSAGIASGRVRVMKEFAMPENIDFEILVTKHTDPGWTTLIALSKGLIIEHGGVLSHASIVARELGIPAVIGVPGATDTFKDGQHIEINGTTGTITIL